MIIIIIFSRLYRPLRTIAYQQTADLSPTCPQKDGSDDNANNNNDNDNNNNNNNNNNIF